MSSPEPEIGCVIPSKGYVLTPDSQPVPRPGARKYVLTPAGDVAALKGELDDVTEDLVRFSQGGAPPEAISEAWDRMVELTRELRIVQPDEPRDGEDEWLRLHGDLDEGEGWG